MLNMLSEEQLDAMKEKLSNIECNPDIQRHNYPLLQNIRDAESSEEQVKSVFAFL
jgi:hypothetical protein